MADKDEEILDGYTDEEILRGYRAWRIWELAKNDLSVDRSFRAYLKQKKLIDDDARSLISFMKKHESLRQKILDTDNEKTINDNMLDVCKKAGYEVEDEKKISYVVIEKPSLIRDMLSKNIGHEVIAKIILATDWEFLGNGMEDFINKLNPADMRMDQEAQFQKLIDQMKNKYGEDIFDKKENVTEATDDKPNIDIHTHAPETVLDDNAKWRTLETNGLEGYERDANGTYTKGDRSVRFTSNGNSYRLSVTDKNGKTEPTDAELDAFIAQLTPSKKIKIGDTLSIETQRRLLEKLGDRVVNASEVKERIAKDSREKAINNLEAQERQAQEKREQRAQDLAEKEKKLQELKDEISPLETEEQQNRLSHPLTGSERDRLIDNDSFNENIEDKQAEIEQLKAEIETIKQEQRREFIEGMETDLRNILLHAQGIGDPSRLDQILGTAYAQYKNILGQDFEQGYEDTDDFKQFRENYFAKKLPDNCQECLAEYDEAVKLLSIEKDKEDLLKHMDAFYGQLTSLGKKVFGADVSKERLIEEAEAAIKEWTKGNGEQDYPINTGLDWNKNHTGILNSMSNDEHYQEHVVRNTSTFWKLYAYAGVDPNAEYGLMVRSDNNTLQNVNNQTDVQRTWNGPTLPTTVNDQTDVTKVKTDEPENTGGGNGGDDGGDGGNDDGGDDDNPKDETTLYSDQNEFLIDQVKLQVLNDMGVINDATLKAAIADPQSAITELQKHHLDKNRQADFENRLTVKYIGNDQLFELLPPRILKEQYLKAKDNNSPDLNKIAARIDELVEEYENGERSIYSDQLNYDTPILADIYDEFSAMLEERYKDITSDPSKTQIYHDAQTKLDKDINLFDQAFGLDRITSDKKSQKKIAENQKALSQLIEQVQLPANVLNDIVAHFEFEDANGKIQPQFVDANGQPAMTLQQGGSVAPDSQLAQMLVFAKNNTVIQNIDKQPLPSVQDLSNDIALYIGTELAHISNIDKTAKDALKDDTFKYDAATNSYPNMQTFVASCGNLNGKFRINNDYFESYRDRAVNDTLSCINRIAKKTDNPQAGVLRSLYAPVAKYDPRAKDRFATASGKLTTKDWFRTAGITLGMSVFNKAAAYGLKYGTGLLGVNGGAGLGLPICAGAVAIANSGIALAALRANYKRVWKDEHPDAKPNEKPTLKGMLQDKRFRSQFIASSMGCVAGGLLVVAGATPIPAVRTSCYIAAGVVGGAAMFISGRRIYKTALEENEHLSKKEARKIARKKVCHQMSAILTGAFLGNALTTFGMHVYNNHIDPTNELMQNKDITPGTPGTPGTPPTVGWDTGKIDADAQSFLARTWYHNDPAQLAADIKANGGSAETLLYRIDAGGWQAPDHGAHNGMHTLFGASFMQQHPEVDPAAIDILKDPNASLADLQSATDSIRGSVDPAQNFTLKTSGVETRPDLYPGRTPESTYSGVGDMSRYQIEIPGDPGIPGTPGTPPVINYHEHDPLTFGFVTTIRAKTSKLKDRIGALFGKKKKAETETPLLPSGDQPLQIPTGEKPKQIAPRKKVEELSGRSDETKLLGTGNSKIDELAEKEYRLVRGLNGQKVINSAELEAYKKLVEKEFQQIGDTIITGANMEIFYKRRMNVFKQVMKDNDINWRDAEKLKTTKENLARQEMWSRKILVDGKEISASETTLLHLTECVAVGRNNGSSNPGYKGAIDPSKVPSSKTGMVEGFEIQPGKELRNVWTKKIEEANANQLNILKGYKAGKNK